MVEMLVGERLHQPYPQGKGIISNHVVWNVLVIIGQGLIWRKSCLFLTQDSVEVTLFENTTIWSTALTTNVHKQESMVSVHNCHEDNGKKLLIVVVVRSWSHWPVKGNVLSIYSSTTVVKLPSGTETIGYHSPLFRCLGALYSFIYDSIMASQVSKIMPLMVVWPIRNP